MKHLNEIPTNDDFVFSISRKQSYAGDSSKYSEDLTGLGAKA